MTAYFIYPRLCPGTSLPAGEWDKEYSTDTLPFLLAIVVPSMLPILFSLYISYILLSISDYRCV